MARGARHFQAAQVGDGGGRRRQYAVSKLQSSPAPIHRQFRQTAAFSTHTRRVPNRKAAERRRKNASSKRESWPFSIARAATRLLAPIFSFVSVAAAGHRCAPSVSDASSRHFRAAESVDISKICDDGENKKSLHSAFFLFLLFIFFLLNK